MFQRSQKRHGGIQRGRSGRIESNSATHSKTIFQWVFSLCELNEQTISHRFVGGLLNVKEDDGTLLGDELTPWMSGALSSILRLLNYLV